MIELLAYLAPLTPFLTRGVISAFNCRSLSHAISPDVQDRDTYRALILTLSGFSFTGLLGVTIAGTALGANLDLTVYYLLASFLSFIATLSIQSYKNFSWLDVLSDMFFDAAILTLILSVFAVIIVSTFSIWVKGLAVAGLLIWLIDHIVQLIHAFKDLRTRK